MHWYILGSIYVIIVILVCLRILYDTVSTGKTFAYLLVAILFPGFGIIIYFAVGANYRKNKIYSKKIATDSKLLKEIREKIVLESEKSWNSGEAEVRSHKKLARLLLNDNSPLSGNNEVKLLLNGENKFPEVIAALKDAKHHIHIEYYIFENDNIGNQIKDILIQKAGEGVKVRFIYDDFGSRSIRHTLVPELIAGGVEAFPFYKIFFVAFSNRTNYRNHRKIIVVDGCAGFVGGINVSDRYINQPINKKQVFWRDTHVQINGPGVFYLQYLFIADWNFSAGQHLKIIPEFFCSEKSPKGNAVVQIAASGPDSETPTIMLSLMEVIGMAQTEILITSPYFIPGETILNALNMATLSGVRVKLLVPKKSDSFIVNAAARSYYGSIMDCGAEIYLYKKGFVHAKTIVADDKLAVVGTANMDHRSFELNFEVNSVIYDDKIAAQLKAAFLDDLKDAVKIDPKAWRKRTLFKQLPEKLCRLFAPLL
ncbi:cardiolipin synthase [Mucilaginibacter xinganensis]|uniref:Cardiolipin synthase n=1 Tax=Mucilaginibacter xinganensis TaxID=1234841 RepID=A0A223NWB9_9SPHI|nr:cardiolipin synthase [Mucilaginibacter xinganensis]ASU34070.1 cardiolipin synthase [Mucilaginibacter xinganensis]